MKFVITNLLALVALSPLAKAQLVCESAANSTSARLEFQFDQPGRMKATRMEYQGRSVLGDPLSDYNNMGVIFFHGADDINFHASENSDDFFVTVPAFGTQITVTRGKCRPQNSARDIIGRGELGDGLFGTCSDPDSIGYLGIAKSRANYSAYAQCAPLSAHRTSDYEISTECINDSKTAVARANYHCE